MDFSFFLKKNSGNTSSELFTYTFDLANLANSGRSESTSSINQSIPSVEQAWTLNVAPVEVGTSAGPERLHS